MHNVNPPPFSIGWPQWFGVATLCALTSWLGVALLGGSTLFHLGSGVALAAALIGGRPYVLAAGVGALIAHLLITGSFWGSLVTASSGMLAAWLSAWLIQRDDKFKLDIPSLRDVSRVFFLGGVVGASLSALVGAGALVVRGAISGDAYGDAFLEWWMGDALGVILVTPVILTWQSAVAQPLSRPSAKKVLEAAWVLACTGFAGCIIFLGWAREWVPLGQQLVFDEVASGYWMLFFIAWAAMRLGTRGTSLALLLIAALGIWGVLQGSNRLGHGGDVPLVRYWTFTVILSLSGMALAVYIAASTKIRLALARSEAAVTQELQNKLAALDQHAIVATTDVQGRITSVNDRFCEISGYSRDELVGQDHRLLKSGAHPSTFFQAMYRAVANGQSWNGEICNRAKDGRLYWVQTTITPFMGHDGKPTMYVAIRVDITAHKQAEENLRQSEERLNLATRSGGVGIWDMDLERKTLTWDDVMFTLYGVDCVHFTDAMEAWKAGIHPDDLKREAKAIKKAIKGGKPLDTQFRVVYPDGRIRHIRAAADLIRGENGKPLRLVGVNWDITSSKHKDAELAKHRDHLEELVQQQTAKLQSSVDATWQALAKRKLAEEAAIAANQAKSQFLANMSHEIRTPMNGVIGMIDILQETELKPEQHRMLDTIHHSSLALLNILNDILDFSKMEAGKLRVERIPTHLREVVEEVVHLMLNVATSRGTQVTLFVDPALPAWIYSDPTRLRQVLLNLLGNALKFVAPGVGQVMLRVRPFQGADGVDCVQLSMSDNGIGMSDEVVAQLFKPFTQGDTSTARKFGGTGLGLSITRGLVAMMQGQIAVRSTPGMGSEFTVDLALEAAPAPADHQPYGESAKTAKGSGATKLAPSVNDALASQQLILMAEDNETNCEVMLTQLHLLGYQAEVAQDGVQALDMWRSGRYALLLTDCHMPRMDGFELTDAIRQAEPEGTRLPIVAITAIAMQGDAERCLARGMDDFLSKPLRLKELRQVLEKWLQPALPSDPPCAEPVSPPVPTALVALAVWHAPTLGELVGDNPTTHRRLLERFLLNAEVQVASIEAASAAGDNALLVGEAHTLKSAARSVGALVLGELCQSLEVAGRADEGAQCSDLAAHLRPSFAAAAAAIRQHVQRENA